MQANLKQPINLKWPINLKRLWLPVWILKDVAFAFALVFAKFAAIHLATPATRQLYTSCTEAMNTHDFIPSIRGTFLTNLQGCIHGVFEIMCIHYWCLGSTKAMA
jgi:hypothetical protein